MEHRKPRPCWLIVLVVLLVLAVTLGIVWALVAWLGDEDKIDSWSEAFGALGGIFDSFAGIWDSASGIGEFLGDKFGGNGEEK